MRIRLLNLLLLVALLLASSRFTQLLREPPAALPPVEAESIPPTPSAATGEPEAAPGEAKPEAYDVIVARNLFSPTRGVVQPAPTVAGKPAPPQPPKPPPKLTLYGVVILDGEKTAYLQEGTQEARPKRVKEKEHIAGGTVTAIRPDGVTFLFAGAEITIPLRSPKEVPAARGADAGAAAAATARSRPPANVPRRTVPPPVVPGQMPIGAAPGQPPAAAGEEPAAAGMPVFPAAAEPTEEFVGEEEILPEEFPQEGEDEGMPIEERTE